MDTETIQHEAEAIGEQFPDDVSVDVEQVEKRLEILVGEYQVPLDEARRSVTNHFLERFDLKIVDLSFDWDDDADPVPLVEVTSAGEWITVEAQVVQLWEPRADSIAQVGLLGDESGTCKFTKWRKSDLPELEEGETYRFENVVTDEYQGRFSVNLNKRTTIEAIDVEIEVGDNEVTVEGALVAIQPGSGLIKRCPEEDCTRVLQNDRCAEHGIDNNPGVFDLRLKAVLDDGDEVHDVLFDADVTAEVTGVDLERAKHLAMDRLDKSAVLDEMTPAVLGRYYRVTGPAVGRYVLAETVEPPATVEAATVLNETSAPS